MSKTRGKGTRNKRSSVLSFFKDITMKTQRKIPVTLKSTFELDWSFAFVSCHEWRRQKNNWANKLSLWTGKITKSKLLAFLPGNYPKIHLFMPWEPFALKEKYFLIIFSTFKPLRDLFLPDSFGSQAFSSSWVDGLWWLTPSLGPKQENVISIYAI